MYRIDSFSKVKVLVVGDVMLDKYYFGDVTRISPEAPVPVVRLKNTTLIAGGAANVAANILGLGANACLVGIVGDDPEGDLFTSILKEIDVKDQYILKIKNRQTTLKTRIIAHHQQIARLDQETIDNLSKDDEEVLWKKLEKEIKEFDIIVVSDYGKGFLSDSLLARLIKKGKGTGKKILIDPKGRDYSKYFGATVVTPNKFEVAEVCGCSPDHLSELKAAGKKLMDSLELEAVVITRGEGGVSLIENDHALDLAAAARDVYDVTGAGDTFIAAIAVAIAAGESLSTACKIANTAAGLAVEQIGTTVVKYKDLKDRLEKDYK